MHGETMKLCESSLLWSFKGHYHNKYSLIYLFKVNLNKSEYILELLYNSKMKRNLKLIILRDTIAVYGITTRKDADIFHLLKTKLILLYIRNQSVPRCKHSPPKFISPDDEHDVLETSRELKI